ncbi:tRNA-uridine aminocarboxypropyltransferase [Ottowia thiooxydans]|uniref:tRNA-uridine aminocarboxypropyltransferase n=1 Tax=Ottowia thiooxydans TaxID=219182 RepID=A0ABV2Q3B8_9BURK
MKPDHISSPPLAPHAVSLLRTRRIARSTKPFMARGGVRGERCTGCRLRPSHCLCSQRPTQATQAGVCLLLADTEPLKPSNTGWLVADVVADTFAFGWARTEVDADLLALLADPEWQPYIVFPGEYVSAERVLHSLDAPKQESDGVAQKRPLFVLLDATWSEARKMFRKSPYLDRFPVLSLQPERLSRYRLRRSTRSDHFCTAEVAAMCLELSGDLRAAQTLEAYLDLFTHYYLQAKQQLPANMDSPACQAWRNARTHLPAS